MGRYNIIPRQTARIYYNTVITLFLDGSEGLGRCSNNIVVQHRRPRRRCLSSLNLETDTHIHFMLAAVVIAAAAAATAACSFHSRV